MKAKHQEWLQGEAIKKLDLLDPNQKAAFGIMTPHHMVEHLIFVTKSLTKRHGEPSGEMTKSQQSFRRFVDNGCPFEYKPKDDAKLNDLRTPNIKEAIKILDSAIRTFYQLFETNPDHKSYNERMGEFNLSELELFHYQHIRWHLFQFGLVEEFAPYAETT